jgi:hypothetical protein
MKRFITQKEGGKSAVKCPTQKTLKRGIAGCPDTGCGGSLDPLLNQQKNTTEGDPDTARHITFADFAGIPNVVEGYKGIGFPRDKVRDQGEGDMVRVVAWALASRPQKTSGKDKNGKPKKAIRLAIGTLLSLKPIAAVAASHCLPLSCDLSLSIADTKPRKG